jgi:hypothetical protein
MSTALRFVTFNGISGVMVFPHSYYSRGSNGKIRFKPVSILVADGCCVIRLIFFSSPHQGERKKVLMARLQVKVPGQFCCLT